ncbi:hypothetical protein [Bradyrhizobium sp. 142]|uniref:hypothetical protein n=1 Tax=Bradyrhizobium sp. 142 TaxID=2782618 RepID=UPI001FF7697B|nr:hypothetical protein [Bradyrhizobium sp. 142]MCK1730983.1 hypothetical protein [Bradyrhizobium sp. 142]
MFARHPEVATVQKSFSRRQSRNARQRIVEQVTEKGVAREDVSTQLKKIPEIRGPP